ncbi:hypothetical protein NEF87_001706 [Candidatus Lokiarchaeum ossiferum]|uniref:Uncharacterized protein n=1 Tax=Candidatus Lokiarchaeum ossiferum TaxID=2951803 RepID=A0ABY6HS94_9ARCH|nr:hypothetical protein NEF87_001706 [Candidatus Lokiarchaeum sp. B-35]
MVQNNTFLQGILDIESVLSIIQLFVIGIIIVYVIRYSMKYKHRNMKYYILSMVAFFVGNLVPKILQFSIDSFKLQFIFSSSSFLILLISSLFLILFFESFKYEHVLTKKNQLFVSSVIVILSAMVTFLIVFFSILDFSTMEINFGPGGIQDAQFIQGMQIFKSLAYVVIALTTCELISLLLFIRQSIKRSTNDILIKKYKIIAFSIIFSILLSILSAILTSDPTVAIVRAWNLVVQFFLLLNYIIICITVFRGGIFMFQENSLRKLLIIDNNGISYYSFDFQRLESKNTDDNSDLLFSGALNAVGKIFGELTGNLQNHLEEMVFNNIHLLIEQIPDTDLSVILLMEKSTVFYKEAIRNFALNFKHIGEIESNLRLDKDQTKEANRKVREFFGFNQISV